MTSPSFHPKAPGPMECQFCNQRKAPLAGKSDHSGKNQSQLKKNWRREFHQTSPSLPSHVVQGGALKRRWWALWQFLPQLTWAMLDQHFESSPKLLLFESTPWRRFLRWSKTTECGFLLPELEFLAVDSLAQPAMVSKSQLVDLIAREHLEGEANPMTQGQKEGTFNDPEGKDARLTVGRICGWRLSVGSLNIHAARRNGAPDFKKSICRIPSLAPAAQNQRNNALEPRTIANLRIGHVVHARLGLVANGEKVARCLNSC